MVLNLLSLIVIVALLANGEGRGVLTLAMLKTVAVAVRTCFGPITLR